MSATRWPTAATGLALALALGASWGPAGVRATRCDFAGGWALRNNGNDCPRGTTQCDGGIVPRCCPDATFCWETDNGYCCPTNTTDCFQDVVNVPKCPNKQWSLWNQNASTDELWCCRAGMYGVGIGDGVKCRSLGVALASGETAATQVTHAASTCSTVPASSTPPSSSDASTAGPSTGTATHTDTPNTDAPAPPISSKQGVGGGAIAGIVIGCVAGVALVVLVAWLVMKRRAAQRRQFAEVEGDSGAAAVAELSAREMPAELVGDADAPGASHETAYELPAGRQD
ncbi:hypothetical protein SPI_03791 [Niveomyces insectorum RCEF 264]|uniref:Uncharacterized protein n=1 Tax=Niveomyces insectorum RCEF 264 TaxID=1081102 RepID=A0A167WCZ7_9HYPO|nr:hypothetical protein SPI_03791 [Niveomyces insectorum RCEF 264]